MKKLLLFLTILFCAASSRAQSQLGGGSGGASASATNTNVIDLVAYGAKFNWKSVEGSAVTVTNTSANITVTGANFCDASGTPCAAGQITDVGKLIILTNGCCNLEPGGVATSLIPRTGVTILSVQSATQATLSSAATGTCTATSACWAAWGTNDDVAWTAADTAYQAALQCPVVLFSSGGTNVTQAHFNTANNACRHQGAPGGSSSQATFRGQGSSASTIFIPPNFNYASCTGGPGAHGCLFSTAQDGPSLYGFSVQGGWDEVSAGGHSTVFINPGQGGVYSDLLLAGLGASDGTTTGMSIVGVLSFTYNLNCEGFGTTCVNVSGGDFGEWVGGACGNSKFGCSITTTGTYNTVGVVYGQTTVGVGHAISYKGTGIWNSKGDFVYGNPSGATDGLLANAATGTINVDGAHITASRYGIDSITSATKIYVKNSIIQGTTAAVANGSATIFDQGGNTWTGGMNPPYIADGHSIKGTCSGVANASVTNSLYGTGPNITATTCAAQTSTLGTGIVIQGARTLQNLSCTSTATTVSVACTVMLSHNGGAFGATTLTCTMTAATSCVDITHSPAAADGDRISIQIVTGAAETGANINALLEWN